MNIRKEIYRSQDDSYKKDPMESAINLASKAAATYVSAKVLGGIRTGIDPSRLRFVDKFTVGGKKWYDPALGIKKAGESATVREFIWNGIKASEEQLLKIPRAFSLSSLYGRGILSKGHFELPEGILRKNLDYLRYISQGRVNSRHLKEGLVYKGGKLYSSVDKSFKDPLLKYASIIPGRWNVDAYAEGKRLGYTSRQVEALQTMLGFKPSETDAFITGGQKWFKPLTNQIKAYGTVAMQNYMKLLDDPFELFSDYIEKIGGRASKAYGAGKKASQFWEHILLKNQFGVGGRAFLKEGNAISLLKRHMMRGLPKLAAIGLAYKAADTFLRTAPIIKDTGLGLGFSGLFAKGYQDIHEGYAKVSDITGMTAYNKWQNKNAKGSTSLLGLISFPASFAIAGATAGGIANLIQKTPIGQKAAAPELFSRLVTHLEGKNNFIGKTAKSLGLSKLSRVGAFASIGAALGIAAVLPLVPGALGSSKSEKELEKIHSGEELVPVRRGRFWEFGTSPFGGTDIDYYAPDWTVRAMSDAGEKGRLPEEYYNNPLRMMAERVLDPYALEKKLDKERPYNYWGSSDMGLGLTERLLFPIKEAFKPTILAHPEALSANHPAQMMRRGRPVPSEFEGTKEGATTYGYAPEVESPAGLRSRLSNVADSVVDVFGIHGFALSSIFDTFSGNQSFLTPNAVYEQSGRILSAQRSFWEEGIGGAFGTSEAYRRLNPSRPYATEFVSSAIRNTMPSWIPDGRLRYGDPYAQLPHGELRLPGRGYAALHPELRGVDYEDYPLVHRMNILNSVAPMSPEYFGYEAAVRQQITNGDLNYAGENLYNEVLRQREEKQNEDRFDYGNGVLGSYYLGLKKLGRSLPTESLYPLSPVHKFAGPADPITEYKSFELLDKQYKMWQNPLEDYIRPALNRTVDFFSLADYIPQSTKEHTEIESNFEALQAAKNDMLMQKAQQATAQKDFEAASFYRSGIRKTIYGKDPSGDLEELTSLLPRRSRRYMKAFAKSGQRDKVLNIVTPEMQQILSAQWQKQDYWNTSDIEGLKNMHVEPIQGVEPLEVGDTAPDNDWIGYAPGVSLNAFKLKTVNSMGKNIRDFNLWREDEREAQILDAHLRNDGDNFNKIPDTASMDRELSKRAMSDYLQSIGMRGYRISAIPSIGPTSVNLQLNKDNRNELRDQMKDQGWISL